MGGDGGHSLHNINAGIAVGRSAVPVDHGGAVGVHVADESRAQEEGGVVPAGCEGHADLTAGSFRGGEQLVPGFCLIGSDLGGIVVQEVVVAAAHGESVDIAVLGSGRHGAFAVGSQNVIQSLAGVGGQDGGDIAAQIQQSACRNQIVQLVVCKGEDIGGSLNVGQDGVLGGGLGLDADLDVEGLVGISSLEFLDQLSQQRLILFRAPQGQRDGLIGSVSSSFGVCVIGSGRLGLGGAAVAAAGSQRQDHDKSQQQSKQFFLFKFLLLFHLAPVWQPVAVCLKYRPSHISCQFGICNKNAAYLLFRLNNSELRHLYKR